MTAVVTPMIDVSWSMLTKKLRTLLRFSSGSLDDMELLVEFVCNVIEFIEGWKLEGFTSTELVSAISTLRASMRQCATLAELLLHFISLKEESLQSRLVGRAIAAFSNAFDGHRPPLALPPLGVYNLAVIFERLLRSSGEFGSGTRDITYYSAVVRMISTLLTRSGFLQCFRDNEWKDEGSVRIESRTKEILSWSRCGAYWIWIRDKRTQQVGSTETMKTTIHAFVVACYLCNLDAAFPSLNMLIPQGTFMPLFTRAALSWQLLGDNALGDAEALGGYNWRSKVRKDLFDAWRQGVYLSGAVENSVGFLEAIDALRTAKSLTPDPATDIPLGLWKDFCALGRLYEQERRTEVVAHRMQWMSQQVGCRWTKCPMYQTGGRERRELLVCSRCKAAVYCSELCQKRDGEEQHQLVCQL